MKKSSVKALKRFAVEKSLQTGINKRTIYRTLKQMHKAGEITLK